MIPFNKPPVTGDEIKYISKSLTSEKISGDGDFTKKCQKWFDDKLNCHKSLLTSSCTHAIEMAAIILNIREGDEVIMPSYTFVSTANAFVLRGAKIVFVDINPDTMNIDESKIESAITDRTKAIVPVHYAGVGCNMDAIKDIANKHNLYIIEDAAQGMMSKYKGQYLGTLGHLGTYSFHESKNYTSAGEGGLLIINDDKFIDRAEIIREKGTNRSKYFRGQVDKYTWIDIGSSYLMNDVSAAYLWGQLEKAEKINKNRLKSWQHYNNLLNELENQSLIQLPKISKDIVHNAHMYYIKVENAKVRDELIKFLKKNDIWAVFHYIPLHTSIAGKQFGLFNGDDNYTTTESEKLLRLPLYYRIGNTNIEKVVTVIKQFYDDK